MNQDCIVAYLSTYWWIDNTINLPSIIQLPIVTTFPRVRVLIKDLLHLVESLRSRNDKCDRKKYLTISVNDRSEAFLYLLLLLILFHEHYIK